MSKNQLNWICSSVPSKVYASILLNQGTFIDLRKQIQTENSWIVGGASGIGLETARVLALRNAHVIIAARNMETANDAKQLILKDNHNARVDVLKLNLASLKSVKAFADNFIALNLPLNILM